MELIIEKGKPRQEINFFPTVEFWVDQWISGQDSFEIETSGTSGLAKKMIFQREQLVASAARTCEYFGLREGTNVLHRLPMQFVAGKMNLVRAIEAKHNVWSEEPSMKFGRDWNDQKMRWNWWTTTPAMLTAYLEANLSLNSFDQVLLGGGKVMAKLAENLVGSKCKCFESYGAAETLSHIAVRNLNVRDGYFKTLEGVHLMKDEKGLHIEDDITRIQTRLNDLIEWHEKDRFEVVGRADDVINTGGVKVHPLLVEDLLLPWIKVPFFITSVNNDKWGHAITLVVEKESNLSWEKFPIREVFKNNPLWMPKYWIEVEKILVNGNGKIVRKYNEEYLAHRFE